MTKSILVHAGAALAVLLGSGLATGQDMARAQTAPNTIRLPNGALNPFTIRQNLQVNPVMASCGNSPAYGVSMGPCQGPVGTQIRVRLARNLGATPIYLSFKAVVSRGIPARVTTRLGGSGGAYATSAPIQLCMQGGGSWEAELILSNGQNIGTIGGFTPTNCPR